MKQRQIVRQGQRVAVAACGLLMCAWSLQSCKDDDLLLTGQPSWLGNSIYERWKKMVTTRRCCALPTTLGRKRC